MLKTIIAYIITIILAPLISGIAGLIVFLLIIPIGFLQKKVSYNTWIMLIDSLRGVISIIIGFIAVWIGTLIFILFHTEPTILMVIILGLGFGINSYRRISHSKNEIIRGEIIGGLGSLIGIILGGIYFL